MLLKLQAWEELSAPAGDAGCTGLELTGPNQKRVGLVQRQVRGICWRAYPASGVFASLSTLTCMSRTFLATQGGIAHLLFSSSRVQCDVMEHCTS